MYRLILATALLGLSSCAATNDQVALNVSETSSVSDSTAVVSAGPTPAAPGPGLAWGVAPLGTDDEPEGLLEALLANGSLTQAQFDRFKAGDADGAGPSVSVGPKGFWGRSADGKSSIKVGGRVQVDANHHGLSGVPDSSVKDGTELRRARLEMKGTLPEGVIWAAEADFADNKTSLKDFWVGIKGDGNKKLALGNQKQPYSLDVEMSSNDIPFVERGVDTFLVIPFVDRAIGARVDVNNDSVFAAAGVFGAGVSPVSMDDEGWGVTGRFVTAPVQSDTQVLHLGVRGSYRDPEGAIRIRDESTNMSDFRVVDSGALMGVKSVMLCGAEAVYALGPVSLGGEANSVSIYRDGNDYSFSSWHAQATYSLTGESRAKAYRIQSGEFKRLKAEGKRAWEIAARLANIDLNDSSLLGGSEDVVSLGLNWYFSQNLRFLLGWSRILNTNGGLATTAAAEGMDIVSFRAQLNF